MGDEASYVCDACREEVVVPVGVSAGASQVHVEDRRVRRRPNVVHVEIDGDEVRVRAEPE